MGGVWGEAPRWPEWETEWEWRENPPWLELRRMKCKQRAIISFWPGASIHFCYAKSCFGKLSTNSATGTWSINSSRLISQPGYPLSERTVKNQTVWGRRPSFWFLGPRSFSGSARNAALDFLPTFSSRKKWVGSGAKPQDDQSEKQNENEEINPKQKETSPPISLVLKPKKVSVPFQGAFFAVGLE